VNPHSSTDGVWAAAGNQAHRGIAWAQTWAAEIKRVLKPNGSLFLNLGASPSNPLLPQELIAALSKLFVLQNTCHWIKAINAETPESDLRSPGHFKPINSRRFVNNCHEFVFHLTKTGSVPLDRPSLGVPYADKSNVMRRAWKKELATRGVPRRLPAVHPRILQWRIAVRTSPTNQPVAT